MTLGQNISRYRKEAGLTQMELAAKVGIHKNYLCGIENDHFKPHLKTIELIAVYLNVSLDALLKEEGD